MSYGAKEVLVKNVVGDRQKVCCSADTKPSVTLQKVCCCSTKRLSLTTCPTHTMAATHKLKIPYNTTLHLGTNSTATPQRTTEIVSGSSVVYEMNYTSSGYQ